jgi:hypothetical protein
MTAPTAVRTNLCDRLSFEEKPRTAKLRRNVNPREPKRLPMTLLRTIGLPATLLVLGSAMALAQTPAPPTTPSASAPSAAAPAAASDRKAVSKECSAEANAKGLHGKERQKFRADCKKNAAKPG